MSLAPRVAETGILTSATKDKSIKARLPPQRSLVDIEFSQPKPANRSQ